MEELEIAQGVFKAILDKYTDPILSMIGKKAKEGWGKFKIDFDIAFRKYIKKSYDKYSKVKTILYKAEPQFIYDFFEIPNLKIGKGIIPEKLHLFYANAFETLYEKHDATKTGFKREIRSKLSFDDFKRVFGQFCFITYAQGKIELSSDDLHSILRKISEKRIHFDIDEYIYDLQNALCLIYLDGLNYRFAHRSFQEYFTAFFLKELSDSDLKKTAVWLINQDPSRAAQDGVFHMLYDMTDDRFEQCVFLPIISAFEEEIQCTLTEPGDAVIFDKLFEIFVQDIHLRRFTEDNGIHLWLGMRTTEKYSFFVLEMSLIFSRKNIPYDDEANEKIQREELFIFLIENRAYKEDERIDAIKLMKDAPVYGLVKQTWIGRHIGLLCEIKRKLCEKAEKSSNDLQEMLDGLLGS